MVTLFAGWLCLKHGGAHARAPLEWLLISPSQWLQAFKVLKEALVTDSALLPIIRKDIQRKSQYLPRWQPALKFIFDQVFIATSMVHPRRRLFLSITPQMVECGLVNCSMDLIVKCSNFSIAIIPTINLADAA